MLSAPPRLLLLDFDGVLAQFHRPTRLACLARHAGCDAATVQRVLYDSGLETAYDSGQLATADYLHALGLGLGCAVDEAAWLQSRLAACRAQPRLLHCVAEVARHTPIAILTNNGALMARAIERIVPSLFPALAGRVLCSGQLGGRKPQREVFLGALAQLGCAPRQALFVDDLFVNVRGARAAGLRADTVADARSLRRVLRRHRLLD